MRELCIPVPEIHGGQNTVIMVTSPDQDNVYKLEVFDCKPKSDKKLNANDYIFKTLKNKIEHYDNSWELIQVFAPEGDNIEVRVLFRKR